MRKRFEVQYEVGTRPIEHINIPMNSRDELPPVLRALKYIYTTPKLNTAVFDLLEEKILSNNSKETGRPGMSLWEILVLGVVRLTLDINYDRLEHIANYDSLVRAMLGVSTFGGKIKRYPLQTIKDNVSLLDEETINKINELVVKAGHRIKRTKKLEVKVDSYVLESNVHFPTDLNLLWDACRKSIELVVEIVSGSSVSGWRKYNDWLRRIKLAFIKASKESVTGGRNKEERLIEETQTYLELAKTLSKKIKSLKDDISRAASELINKEKKLSRLEHFEKMLAKHIDLVERRIIDKEKIPHEEKVFSLFEPYTEWVNKGKAGHKIELGMKIAVSTDQYSFILHHRLLEKLQDVEATLPIAERLLEWDNVDSISFDKGFWSKSNYEALVGRVPNLIMPKKGKLNKEEYEREHRPQFMVLRRKRSAIESDINSLEHHGLNRCPDKGIDHFKRYAALGILSFNLHRLGNILLEIDQKKFIKQKRYQELKAA